MACLADSLHHRSDVGFLVLFVVESGKSDYH